MLFRPLLSFITHDIRVAIPFIVKEQYKIVYTSAFRSNHLRNTNYYWYCHKAASDSTVGSTENDHLEDKDRKNLEKWIEMLRHHGESVPIEISEENFLKLCNIPTELGKKRFLSYLYGRENYKILNKAVKIVEKEQREKLLEERKNRPRGHIDYGLWKYSMFIKATKDSVISLLHYKLINAMKFNQPLVIDLSFYDCMREKQANALARQLANCVTQNRFSSEPFNLTLCNVNFDCKKFQIFSKKIMPNILNPDFPINITSKNYLDIYPNEKFIYLSPNSKNVMTSFNYNAIYILGGIVDHGHEHPLTLAKAKRENIETVKLPLHKNRDINRSKSFSINLVLKILLDLQKDGRLADGPKDYFRMVNMLLDKHKM